MSADPGTGVTRDQLEVLSRLHQINQMEMQAGALAKRNSRAPTVKRYGDVLIRDHRQADAEVMQFVDTRNATLATPTPKDGVEQERMRQEHATMEQLQRLEGSEFDREFLPAMVAGHEAAIQLLQQARSDTQDAQLRALYGRLLPLIQQHRDLARKLLSDLESQTPGAQPRGAQPRGTQPPAAQQPGTRE